MRLGPVTLLVGPNGSGKSDFLDAFRLTAQVLTENLDNARRGPAHRAVRDDPVYTVDPEEPRGAKEALMADETLHQPAFAAKLCLEPEETRLPHQGPPDSVARVRRGTGRNRLVGVVCTRL